MIKPIKAINFAQLKKEGGSSEDEINRENFELLTKKGFFYIYFKFYL